MGANISCDENYGFANAFTNGLPMQPGGGLTRSAAQSASIVAAMPRFGAVTRDGRGEVVAGMVIMLKGENGKTVAESVKARMDEIQKSLPKGVSIAPFYDQTEVIDRTARRFGLDTYPNQLEIITAEQMMDAYASVGMPVNYRHWSYGKEFIATEKNYKRGHMGLAYEIVINSNPCISYLMEENTMAMQALVIAHAAYGHNSFFKGNYLFRMWTDASSIIDYLVYAKNYIAQCEERHGIDTVEAFIDVCLSVENLIDPHAMFFKRKDAWL